MSSRKAKRKKNLNMPIFRVFPVQIDVMFCLAFSGTKNNHTMTWFSPRKDFYFSPVLFQAPGVYNLLKISNLLSKTNAENCFSLKKCTCYVEVEQDVTRHAAVNCRLLNLT